MTRPDFSSVTSQEAANELYEAGELEKLFLLPPVFGGDDVPVNVVFVPVGIGAAKHRIDEEVISPMVDSGQVTHYEATPEYDGASVVPTSVSIVASGAGEFRETVRVWGTALET